MKRWLSLGLIAVLLISLIFNIKHYRDMGNRENEYVLSFSSTIDTTNSTLVNLFEKKGENQYRYLIMLHQNLSEMDTLFKHNPNEIYYNYFKDHIRTVVDELNNHSNEVDVEVFSELHSDMTSLYARLFENYTVKKMSLDQFDKILLSVILKPQSK